MDTGLLILWHGAPITHHIMAYVLAGSTLFDVPGIIFLHNHQNEHDLLVDNRNTNTLYWFLNNSAALAQSDCYLLNFSLADIRMMPSRIKLELVRLLTTARDLHSEESALRGKGQSSLTDFFDPI